MDKKVWSMSTTVRNPYRLIEFLRTLGQLKGEVWNEVQIKFQILLIQNRLYKPEEKNLSKAQIFLLDNPLLKLTYAQAEGIFKAKKYVDGDMRGRNSFAPLNKLGLANIKNLRVNITEFGEKVLQNKATIEDAILLSLLKWQYPNPTSRDFISEEGYNTKPFLVTLKLIDAVNQICLDKGEKAKGISKEEFSIFALSLINYKDIEETAYCLIDYREKKSTLKSISEQRHFREKFIESYLKNFKNAKLNNLKDYADNAIRYFRLTKYIYIRGGGFFIDLEPRRMVEIKRLFKSDAGDSKEFTKADYIDYISDFNSYKLPWENTSELKVIATSIIEEINELENELIIKTSKYELAETENKLNKQIFDLRNIRIKLQNLQIKKQFSGIPRIEATIHALKNIRKQPEKASIALEKWVNIGLNIINDAKMIRPNYPVGDDNEPTFTAPGNLPDIECYYESFSCICEVTMLTGRDQWYNEGQPVQRHLRDFEDKNGKSYCVFVSPQIHRDTINTFWNAVKYEYEGRQQRIVPINISQLVKILEVMKYVKATGKIFSHADLQALYDGILDLNNCKNSAEWLENASIKVDHWIKEICV